MLRCALVVLSVVAVGWVDPQARAAAAGAIDAGGRVVARPAPVDDAGGRTVARLGPSDAITVSDLENRIADMPAFQRVAYGTTADAIRRNVLTTVLIPDRLLVMEARARHIEREPPAEYAIERALSGATIRAIRARVGDPSAVSMDEVRAYFASHPERYESGPRYQVWRILCRTREEAQAVLEACRRDPTPKVFAELARDHSQDKATYLRSGNLGFLSEDGSSSFPDFRVDPAIVRAARWLHDGEFVSTPVAEGDYFSVLWRRGTIPAVHRTVDQVADAIRDALGRDRVKAETDRLLGALRSSKVRDVNASLLETIESPSAEATGPAAR
jgi:peptidyl-prolyl cis-trans isomerase C